MSWHASPLVPLSVTRCRHVWSTKKKNGDRHPIYLLSTNAQHSTPCAGTRGVSREATMSCGVIAWPFPTNSRKRKLRLWVRDSHYLISRGTNRGPVAEIKAQESHWQFSSPTLHGIAVMSQTFAPTFTYLHVGPSTSVNFGTSPICCTWILQV